MDRVLGIDLGTQSVGWALVDAPTVDGEIGSVVAMGSRVFPAGAETAGGKTKTTAQERRGARSMRRQIARRRKRKNLLRHELARVGLLPVNRAEQDVLFVDTHENQVAELIARAQRERVELYDLGRIAFHLSTRRGFLSLRKGGGGFGEEGNEEETEMSRFRRIQEAEFLRIWELQAESHPELTRALLFGTRGRLTYPIKPIEQARYLDHEALGPCDEFGVHGLVFFQRAVYWGEGTIGQCPLINGEVRCPRADRLAQRYRINLDLNNLRWRNGRDQVDLTTEQRELGFSKLWSQKQVKFSSLAKAMKLPADTEFNLARGGKDALAGNETDAALRAKGALGSSFDDLVENDKDRIVHILLGSGSVDELAARIEGETSLDSEKALLAADVRLPGGRMRFSRKALRRLLPEVEAGYRLSGKGADEFALQRAGFGNPFDRSAESNAVTIASAGIHIDALIPPVPRDITNPVVRTALTELRKVLRAIARTHGRFDVIRIEFAREAALSQDEIARKLREQNDNRKRNEAAQTEIEEAGGSPHDRVLARKVTLWHEQGEVCLYSGKQITLAQILSDNATEVDHILPRWRSLDNSYMNQAVCLTAENRDKGDRIPFEWLSSDPERWGGVVARAEALPQPKRNRVLQEELDQDQAIAEAALAQTRFAARQSRDWLEAAGFRVEPTRGQYTAELRRRWGLDKDASDHRRHARDAVAIALCDKRTLFYLANALKARANSFATREEASAGLEEPWPGFRADEQVAYDSILVSHKVRRKIRGKLHEETLYGPVGDGQVVIRRPLSAIDGAKKLGEVRDPGVRMALEESLSARGIDPTDKSFGRDPFPEATPPRLPGNTPIRSVRCLINRPAARRRGRHTVELVNLGNNYGGAVYRKASGGWGVIVTPMIDAIARVQRQELFTDLPDGSELLFTLAEGEVIRIQVATDKVAAGLYVVVRIDGGAHNRFGALELAASPTSADRNSAMKLLSAKALESGNARKVTVDAVGVEQRATG